jgi:HK97 family phage portal protein
MAYVESLGAITELGTRWSPNATYGGYQSLNLYNDHYYTYAAIYAAQPNVRTCVDFLARNVAQLGLHVFRRNGETDRVRLRDHPLALLLGKPNPWTTTYRLIEALMGDLGLYFNAYWLKLRAKSGQLTLLRVPPELVTVQGGLVPTRYDVALGGQSRQFAPEQIVHFRGYNPSSSTAGLSPMETLRRVLAEEMAMGRYREGFWTNAARMGGIIERPKDAPEWSAQARERFRAEFAALHSEEASAGNTAILEEGMTWKQSTFSAQESEYVAGRKLTRAECARAYHIPLPMVGILDNATFSNIKEQHRNLYQDCLGPWLVMLEQDIELQLLPEMADSAGVYCEFNIAEKLSGSFEEQTTALQASVGRAWMTPDEARARMNLPSMGGDAAELGTPLNVLIGGQANPQDSGPDGGYLSAEPDGAKARRRRAQVDSTLPETRERHVEKWQRVMEHTFKRQRDAVLPKVPKKAKPVLVIDEIWDAARWNRELGLDYYRLNYATASVWGQYMADEAGIDFDASMMDAWLLENSRIAAEEINGHTRDLIAAGLAADVIWDAISNVFDVALSQRAPELAQRGVTTASVFGAQEGARQGGLRTKTWKVNSKNPRLEHKAMDGETVGIGELFSNGMKWPGDPAGGAENNANCNCSVIFWR